MGASLLPKAIPELDFKVCRRVAKLFIKLRSVAYYNWLAFEEISTRVTFVNNLNGCHEASTYHRNLAIRTCDHVIGCSHSFKGLATRLAGAYLPPFCCKPQTCYFCVVVFSKAKSMSCLFVHFGTLLYMCGYQLQ